MVQEFAAKVQKVIAKSFNEEGFWGVTKTIAWGARLGLSLACLRLIHFQLALLPAQARAIFKGSIHPATDLDYDKAKIKLAADNLMSFERSNACRKEPETIRWIEENVKKGDVFYDIGANVGAYSLVADKICGGDIKVYAFEPSFSTFQLLCKNVILNKSQGSIFPYMICVSEKERLETFNYFSIDAGQSKHTIGSNTIDCLGEAFTPEYKQAIFAYSIDSLVDRWGFSSPNLIKLDVDGTELDILHGASTTLRSGTVRSILVEVSAEESRDRRISTFLHEEGFVIDREVRHKNTVISNLIFKRDGQR